MRKPDWPRLMRNLTLTAIIIVAIVDGVLLAVIRERFAHDHGYDLRSHRRAVAKPAPP
ncbi:MAG TPA: hypothetical protein VMV27_12870 [Candidatus Binataceae bacterium]|nr:hypothetical protein [Candidatus Binataceae bacterium]